MDSVRVRGNSGAVPVPNTFFDELLLDLTDSELRVWLVVWRQTVGWRERVADGEWRRKERDWISHAQLRRKTNRGSEAVSRAIAGLIGRGLLVVEDFCGQPLTTANQRRRHLGKLYYRPVDKWITRGASHPEQAKTTTSYHNLYKELGNRQPTEQRRGWTRPISNTSGKRDSRQV